MGNLLAYCQLRLHCFIVVLTRGLFCLLGDICNFHIHFRVTAGEGATGIQ